MKVYKLSIAFLAFITSCAGALAYKDENIPSLEDTSLPFSYSYLPFVTVFSDSVSQTVSPISISDPIQEVNDFSTTYEIQLHQYEIEFQQFLIADDTLTRTYLFGEKSDNVLQLQIYLDVTKDSVYGNETYRAHSDALNKVGLPQTYLPTPKSYSKKQAVSFSSNEQCPTYHSLALSVGWSEEFISRLSYIMWRESRCDPLAFNSKDPNGGSRGLTQINGYWCKRTSYSPHDAGYLGLKGVINSCEDLFDPRTNLIAAKTIYDYGIERRKCPWGPWTTKKTSWCTK
jgi:hypothetical protein